MIRFDRSRLAPRVLHLRSGWQDSARGRVRVLHRADGLREVDAGAAIRLHPHRRRAEGPPVHQPGPGGHATISSRLGLARPAVEVDAEFDFWPFVVDHLTGGERIDYLVCDEAQFYTAEQIDQLARIVDELQIDVFAVGILTDFQTRLFPGSQRLVELCDRIEVLQVRSLCWCGARATHNARTVNGVMVTEGDQVVVGDTVAPGRGSHR